MSIYITRNGEEEGPYSRADIFAKLKEGALSPDDPAWQEGMEGWRPLKEVLAGMKSQLSFIPPETRPQTVVAPVQVRREEPVRREKVDAPAAVERGGGRLLVAVAVVALLAGGGFWVQRHPAPVRHALESLLAALPGGESKPEQTAEQGAAAQEIRVAAPEPPQEALADDTSREPQAVDAESAPSAPAASSPELDLPMLAASPALWPRTVMLRAKMDFPAVFNGREVGSTSVPAGTVVNLRSVSGDKVTLEFHNGTTVAAAADTDLLERANAMAGGSLARNAKVTGETDTAANSGQPAGSLPRSATGAQGASTTTREKLATQQQGGLVPAGGGPGAAELPGLGVQPPSYFGKSGR
jgi:hypothetical protein